MDKSIENLEATSNKDMIEFLTNQHIYEFINGIEGKKHPITDWMTEYLNLPNLGDHLETPRMNNAYTHHGIYVGNKEVIHYGGLAYGFNSAPIEKVSISKFADGNKYKIIPHSHTIFSKEQIVERAYNRLNEKNYELFSNNCEHFVNWCIYDVDRSDQVSDIVKNIPITPVKLSAVVVDIGKSIKAFADGKIPKEKLFDDIQKNAVTMSSSAIYTTFGATVGGPIGAIVAGTVGYVIGNLLQKSGLVAFGDSNIVKVAKDRRQRAEKICNEMVPIIQESRRNLEKYMEIYFKDRKMIFDNAFEELEISMQNMDSKVFLANLEKINNQYGQTLSEKKSFQGLIEDKSFPKLF